MMLLTAVANAGPVSIGQWYTIGFGGVGSFATDGSVCCALGLNSLYPGDPSWTFTAGAGGATVTITDGFSSGDSFQLVDFGGAVGVTPSVAQGGSCGSDEPACLADPLMSHNLFFLGAGSHSIDIQVAATPFGGGAAFFRIDDGGTPEVPEPSTSLLLGSALAVAALWRRFSAR